LNGEKLNIVFSVKYILFSKEMSELAHKIYIGILSVIVALTLIALIYIGIEYYNTSLEERFYHADHELLKPSGALGHGLGILGSLLMIIGVSTYMARKRYRWMLRMGKLGQWLEFHIFLCTLGPIMVLFHTAFKFGGIVAISFWSMVAVFLSGVIGRFIYIQIPRTIEGRELSLNEVKDLRSDIGSILKKNLHLDDESFNDIVEATKQKLNVYSSNPFIRYFRKRKEDSNSLRNVKIVLKRNNISRNESRNIVTLVKNEIALNRKIDRLQTMRSLFKYWHVAHMPFAMVMLIIMVIHVIVTIVFGYRWIF
jgi:hypothetical protein